LQDIAGGRETDLFGNAERGAPLPDRAVDDETLLRLDRPALVYGQSSQIGSVGDDLQVFQQLPERQMQWPIDDQSQRTAGVMLANVGDRLKKVRIGQRRHGDQELVGQIGGFGHGHSIGIHRFLDKRPTVAPRGIG